MLKNLTGLRFYAALMVFLTHFVLFKYTFNLQDGPVFVFFEGMGAIGVSLFFVLSGFILTINYAGPDAKPLNLKQFYLARFARVYPVFFLTLLLASPIELLSGHPQNFWSLFIPNLFMVHCFYEGACGAINPPAWSISNEFFFYLIFPFCAILFLRQKAWAFPLVFLGCIALVFAIQHFLPGTYWAHTTFPLNRVGEFLCGMLTGHIYGRVGGIIVWEGLAARPWMKPLLYGTLAFFLGLMLAEPFFLNAGVFYLFFMIPGSLIILLLALADKTSLSIPMLSAPLVVLGGEISYSFYMVHQIIMRYVRHGLFVVFDVDLRQFQTWQLLLMGLFWLALALGSAYLMYRYVETPCRNFLRSKLSGGIRKPQYKPAPDFFPQPGTQPT
ncbi:MAG TPA: acyltransferase [Coleofasciculaceae cyanobacterium]|jgi:peptidoglycan/LPS O-acetylase OafA/YrhL